MLCVNPRALLLLAAVLLAASTPPSNLSIVDASNSKSLEASSHKNDYKITERNHIGRNADTYYGHSLKNVAKEVVIKFPFDNAAYAKEVAVLEALGRSTNDVRKKGCWIPMVDKDVSAKEGLQNRMAFVMPKATAWKMEEITDLNELAAAFQRIVYCLGLIHDQGYIHRDIRADNIVIYKGKLAIIDFGSSVHVGMTSEARTKKKADFTEAASWIQFADCDRLKAASPEVCKAVLALIKGGVRNFLKRTPAELVEAAKLSGAK